MSDSGYNGWKTYETWATALWIDNEEVAQDAAVAMALDARKEARGHVNVREGIWQPDRAAVYLLSKALEERVTEDMMPDLGASLAADLLGAATGRIDWMELAEHYLGDLEPEEENEEDTEEDEEDAE